MNNPSNSKQHYKTQSVLERWSRNTNNYFCEKYYHENSSKTSNTDNEISKRIDAIVSTNTRNLKEFKIQFDHDEDFYHHINIKTFMSEALIEIYRNPKLVEVSKRNDDWHRLWEYMFKSSIDQKNIYNILKAHGFRGPLVASILYAKCSVPCFITMVHGAESRVGRFILYPISEDLFLYIHDPKCEIIPMSEYIEQILKPECNENKRFHVLKVDGKEEGEIKKSIGFNLKIDYDYMCYVMKYLIATDKRIINVPHHSTLSSEQILDFMKEINKEQKLGVNQNDLENWTKRYSKSKLTIGQIIYS